MRFLISGADAAKGTDRSEIIEAENEALALAQAKSIGLFVSRVQPVSEPVAPELPITLHTRATKREIPFEKLKIGTWLSFILLFMGVLSFAVAVIAVLGSSRDNAAMAWTIFSSGVMSVLVFLSLARILDGVEETIKRLRRMEAILNLQIERD